MLFLVNRYQSLTLFLPLLGLRNSVLCLYFLIRGFKCICVCQIGFKGMCWNIFESNSIIRSSYSWYPVKYFPHVHVVTILKIKIKRSMWLFFLQQSGLSVFLFSCFVLSPLMMDSQSSHYILTNHLLSQLILISYLIRIQLWHSSFSDFERHEFFFLVVVVYLLLLKLII